MIRIHQGYVTEVDGEAKLITKIDLSADNNREFFISVDSQYKKFLAPERADYALIGMIGYALREKHDDIICEAPVTEELLYNLREILIPTLVKSDSRNYPVKIQADIAPPLEKLRLAETTWRGISWDNDRLKHMDLPYQRQDLTKIQSDTLPLLDKVSSSEIVKGGVGTGLSCGVDSFHAVIKHLNSGYPNQDLTHLATFEVGGVHGLYKNPPLVRQKIFERAEKVSCEIKLPLVKLKSNLQHVIPMDNLYHHTYRDVMTVYAIQKFWKTYYYASGCSFSDFTLTRNFSTEPAYFELLLLDCFSTSGLRLISAGAEGDRNDKIEFISDNPLAQKYLHVCINREFNCGVCEKCLRTLLALDALGKLDNFRESFDIDAYLKVREQAWIFCHDKAAIAHNAPYYARTYKALYARNKEFFDSITPKTKRSF